MQLDPEICYQALLSRDRRFDGRFFTGVVTTGIYCRPICPANKPQQRNCRFFPCASAAEEAGFRPCLRCRPETAPNTPAWDGTCATVSRAIRLIGEGALDDDGVDELATRLGVGSRHLRRLFRQHLGTSPSALAQTRRLHFAQRLLRETDLTVTEVAFSSGYSSVRRFNCALRAAFLQTPTDLRRGATDLAHGLAISVRLPYRPPFAWNALRSFLSARAIPGVEAVDEEAYRRTATWEGESCILKVTHNEDEHALLLTIDRGASRGLLKVIEKVRNLFDLNADPIRIGAELSRDPELARILAKVPGLRVPGSWDGFEIAVRAILGQQVSVQGASRLAGRLVQRFGTFITRDGHPDMESHRQQGLSHLFPSPPELARATPSEIAAIGMPRSRGVAIHALACEVDCNGFLSDRSGGLEGTVARLIELPGIGNWTAEYIAMRALGEPDAFPDTDLVLRRCLERMATENGTNSGKSRSDQWRPWRSYAAMALWYDTAASARPTPTDSKR